MTYLRSNIKAITSLILGICLAMSLADAHADEVEGGGNKGNSVSIDLAFITHLDAELAEHDVYIEWVAGSGEVYRATRPPHAQMGTADTGILWLCETPSNSPAGRPATVFD